MRGREGGRIWILCHVKDGITGLGREGPGGGRRESGHGKMKNGGRVFLEV